MIGMASQNDNWMSPEEEQMWRDAFRKVAFHQAAERDAQDGGHRMDFLLDEMSQDCR